VVGKRWLSPSIFVMIVDLYTDRLLKLYIVDYAEVCSNAVDEQTRYNEIILRQVIRLICIVKSRHTNESSG